MNPEPLRLPAKWEEAVRGVLLMLSCALPAAHPEASGLPANLKTVSFELEHNADNREVVDAAARELDAAARLLGTAVRPPGLTVTFEVKSPKDVASRIPSLFSLL